MGERTGWKADICVVGGAGHVGLPLSLLFASRGQRVLVYDINTSAFDRIRGGEMPFLEQGAEPLLKDALANDRLRLTGRPDELAGVPVVIITIGTPVDEFHSPTLKLIKTCFDEIFPFLSNDQLVVLRSTVYPGVTDWVARYLRDRGKPIAVAFCPERTVQGNAVFEIANLPQIVSGTSPEGEVRASRLFSLLTKETVRLAPIEAEFAKLCCNAYRYIEFAVANQFYTMMASAGVDYYRVLEGLQRHYPRAGNIPRAGLAAGPCLFKDTMQLSAFCRHEFSIGHAAMLTNEGLPSFILDRLRQAGPLEGLTVGLLGMAFKAESDDPRSSLSYKLKKLLAFQAKEVLTTDPYVREDRNLIPADEVVAGSDRLVLCTPHRVYRTLDLRGKPVIDVWNFFGGSAVA